MAGRARVLSNHRARPRGGADADLGTRSSTGDPGVEELLDTPNCGGRDSWKFDINNCFDYSRTRNERDSFPVAPLLVPDASRGGAGLDASVGKLEWEWQVAS
jgi:hypothetical protein